MWVVCMIAEPLVAETTAVAAEPAPLPEMHGPALNADGMDPVTKFLLDDALAQGRITKQRYASLLRDYEERAYERQPSYKLWYDRGFNLGTNDNNYLLRIRGRLDTQFTQQYNNKAWSNPGDAKNFPDIVGVFGDYRVVRLGSEVSTVSLRRARLYLMGHVFNPDMKYFIQIRADSAKESSLTQSTIQLYDYYLANTKIDWLQGQLGQFKVYFNRAQINSTASMQFTEHALVTDAFTASGLDRRDIGLTIMNDEERYPLNYYFGVFGGAGPNFTSLGNYGSEQITQGCAGGQPPPQTLPPGDLICSNSSTTNVQPFLANPLQRNLNANTRASLNRLMFSARLNWNVMGRPGYGEGDLTYSQTPQFAIGGGYAYNPRINTSTDLAFIGEDFANLNIRQLLAAGGNGRELGWGLVDFSTWGADSVFKYRGFSLQGEFYFKNVHRHDKGRPCVQFQQVDATNQPSANAPFSCAVFAPQEIGNAWGWYVQSGYYIIPRYLEVAARYALWDPDTHSSHDLIKQADVSINWFFNGTYDHAIQVSWSNMAMETGGYAIGRSNPLPAISSTSYISPNGPVPVDGVGGTLVQNTLRIQYRLFF